LICLLVVSWTKARSLWETNQKVFEKDKVTMRKKKKGLQQREDPWHLLSPGRPAVCVGDWQPKDVPKVS
jgi:hypothetical protein